MAGFFGFFDYTKPGKGVDPDEPQKHPFFHFWELLWRKLSRFLIINLLYFVVFLPILTLIYIIFYMNLIELTPLAAGEEGFSLPLLPGMLAAIAGSLPTFVAWLLLGLSIILYGPATCGLTYMLRNFYRQEHTWVSDFFDRAKRNFKQGIVLGILDVAVVTLLMMNMFYTVDPAGEGMMVWLLTIAKYLSVLLLVIYAFMRQYTYLMAVTFDLRLPQIMRNAFIFAILGLWRNLLALVLIIVTVVVFVLLNQIVELVMVPLLLFAFCGFIGMFCCYPVVKKHMIPDPPQEEEPESLIEGE